MRPSCKHADQIGVPDGRNAVRDDQRRPARANVAKIVEDLFLGIGIDRRERIVEDKDPRIAHHGPCDRGSLFLAARERDAAFAHELFVFAGKILNVIGKSGDLGGMFRRVICQSRARGRPSIETI